MCNKKNNFNFNLKFQFYLPSDVPKCEISKQILEALKSIVNMAVHYTQC